LATEFGMESAWKKGPGEWARRKEIARLTGGPHWNKNSRSLIKYEFQFVTLNKYLERLEKTLEKSRR
jgi:hypothetical protein